MTIKQRLDKIFSTYIRRKDADATGKVECVCCGRVMHWEDMDCGHFITRNILSLRYYEKNCHPQCKSCNQFKNGNIEKYKHFLVNKYGEDILQELTEIKNEHAYLRDRDYEDLIVFYKEKLEEL